MVSTLLLVILILFLLGALPRNEAMEESGGMGQQELLALFW